MLDDSTLLSHRHRILKYYAYFSVCYDEEWRIGETVRGAKLAMLTSEYYNDVWLDLQQICDLY
jgi:hypothetical protein